MRRLAVLSLLLISFAANAQYYSFGADPARARWSSIKSEHFKLIYPRETDSLARVYLCNLEKARTIANESMLIDTKRIPVVLHPYTVLSNGSVAWAPKCVNLVTSPSAYSGTPESWIDQLTVHEMRHVGQTEHFTKGIFKLAYPFLGEQAAGLGVGLLASTRYLEGDAVLAETQYSNAGRGRSADFLKYQRALYLDGVKLNWERASFGSYRYQDINYYSLGYTIMSSEQLRTGNYNYSGEFFRDRARLYDITKYLQKKADRKYPSKDSLLGHSYDLWSALWQNDLLSRGVCTEGERLSQGTRLYSEMTSPIKAGGQLIALRRSLERSSELVSIDSTGAVKHLKWHNYYSSKLTEALGGRIYWSETVMHNAADLETFSEIRYYDLASGKQGTLTHGTKYFHPCVCPETGVLAAAEYPVGGGSALVLLSPENGAVRTRIAAPQGGQILEPCFVGGQLYATIVGDDGIGVYRLDGDSWKMTVPQQRSDIRHLRSSGGSLLFTGDLDGVLNIYTLDTASLKLTRLTNSKYGADYAITDGSSLIYSEFSKDGYHLASLGAASLRNDAGSFDEPYLHPVAEALSDIAAENSAVEAQLNEDYLDAGKYPSKRYNKLTNALHIHSWAPLYYNVDRIMSFSMDHYYDLASLGATAYSQNELGNVVTMAGYSYHGGCHTAHGKVTATIFDCDVELSGDYQLPDRKWNAGLTVDYPLNLYGGGWQSMFIPYFKLNFTDTTSDLRVGARYYRMLPTATAAVYPRHGFSVNAAGLLPIGGPFARAPQAALSAYCYLPGFTAVQGCKISFSAQHQFLENAHDLSTALTSMPRGYTDVKPEADFAKLTLDYGIPVWLHDVSLGKLLYLKRLELVPFVDVAYNKSLAGDKSFPGSVGSDITVRFNALRLGFELSAGLRYARTFSGDNFFGPLMGVSL